MSDLNYLVRIPKKEVENPPLLILLHGYGSNEQDLFSFSEELPDEFLIISAQAPINMQPGSYAWYDINFDRINGKFSDLKQAKESIDKIAVFIDLIKEKYNIEFQKILEDGVEYDSDDSGTISVAERENLHSSGRLIR